MTDTAEPARRLRSCQLFAMIFPMKIAIDRVGRVVIPKSLREGLGIKPGQELEIRSADGRLEIEVAPTPVRLRKRGKGVAAVPNRKLPTLTADLVRETLEKIRR